MSTEPFPDAGCCLWRYAGQTEMTMGSQWLIRAAAPSDVMAISLLHVRAWQSAYRGHMPDRFLASLDSRARADMWRRALSDPNCVVLVAEGAKGIAGFCSLIPSRDEDAKPTTGELAAIYVDPELLRRGIGSLMLDAVLVAAVTRGFNHLSLWVLHDNAPALAFYRARGFSPDGVSKTQSISTFEIRERRFGKSLS